MWSVGLDPSIILARWYPVELGHHVIDRGDFTSQIVEGHDILKLRVLNCEWCLLHGSGVVPHHYCLPVIDHHSETSARQKANLSVAVFMDPCELASRAVSSAQVQSSTRCDLGFGVCDVTVLSQQFYPHIPSVRVVGEGNICKSC